MSRTTPIPGKLGWEYGTYENQIGVFKWVGKGDDADFRRVLPWYPKVTRFVVRKDHRGKILDTRYTLVISGHEDTMWGDELGAPEAWLRWPGAVGVYDRPIRDALAIIVQNEAMRLPQTLSAPAWEGDALVMPPSDLMPVGYSERSAERPLSSLVEIAARNPKLALIMGFSYACPYVAPLRAMDLSRQSFMVHLTGGQREGKSTGLRTAGSLWGLPTDEGLINSWCNTGPWILGRLGELGCLPIFLDEISSSGFTPAKLLPVLQSALQGAKRGRATRGGRTKSAAPWNGIMFSTGNDSVLGMLTGEPAMRSRVIEIPSPIVVDGPTAEAVDAIVVGTYGTFRERPMAHMLAALTRAELLLGMVDGGAERTILQHLSLGVAGALLVGGESLATAALEAAQELRGVLVAEMSEAGVKPGEQLLEAVRQAITARPGAFPSRYEYLGRLEDTGRPDPQIDGWWEPPTAYVLTSKMDGVVGASDITDALTGLRELKRLGLLDAQGGKLGLRKRVRVGKSAPSTYAITLPEEEDSDTPITTTNFGGNGGNSGNIAGQSHVDPWAAWELVGNSGNSAGQEAAESGETAGKAASDGNTASAREAVTCTVPTFPEAEPVPIGGSGGSGNTPASLDQRRAGRSAVDAEHLSHFGKVIRGLKRWDETPVFPDVTDAQMLAGMRTFTAAMQGLNFAGPPSRVGQLLFERVSARHGSIPVLGAPPEMPDLGARAVTMFNFVDRSQLAALDSRPWVVGMDVNAQFLGACGGCELGTGDPVQLRHSGPWLKEDFKRPGYVRLEADAHFAPGGVIAAGDWVAMPTAEYLNERGLLRASEMWVWPLHRRWLSAWGKEMREGRKALVGRGDLPSALALAALKLTYSTFLGGFLRSTRYNNNDTLRPDWADSLQSLARMNMLRALGKSRPRPLATLADAAYFLLQDNESVLGLALEEETRQPGKWKTHRVGRSGDQATIRVQKKHVTTTLAEQIERGSAAGISAVIADLDRQHRRGKSA